MPRRHRSDGPCAFVWIRGPRGPEPQVWGEEALLAGERSRETVVLTMRQLTAHESTLSLRELAAHYPAPIDAAEG